MPLTFLGESIHGVAEFTQFKTEWIRRHGSSRTLVVFEADQVGLQRSASAAESPEEILRNFPWIHQTREMLELLQEVLARNIPYFGADVVTRNKGGIFTGVLATQREEQAAREQAIYSSPDPFPLRDGYMSDVIASICHEYPEHDIVAFFHNLHIKKNGSREQGELRLASVAEQLFTTHRIESRSIGLFATRGTALHNDLTPFEFAIEDPDVIETIERGNSTGLLQLTEPELMADRTAYHHAFEKETLPVRIQYDECMVFPKANPPTPV